MLTVNDTGLTACMCDIVRSAVGYKEKFFNKFVASLLLCLTGVRLEEYFYEKVQGKRPVLPVDEGLLGQYMVQAGNQFDVTTPYGKSADVVSIVMLLCVLFSVLCVQSLFY